MRHTVAVVVTARQSTSVDLALTLLRRSIADTGCTFEALETLTGKNRSYLHRVLNGDARCTLEFLIALPKDVKANFCTLLARHFGNVVVRPSTAESAASHFAAGLLGLLAVAPSKSL